MKNIFLFVVLFSLPLRNVAQISFPLFAQKPEWRVDVSSFTSWVTGFRYSSDTLFEGKTYSKGYNYLVRNEGKKTWIRKGTNFFSTTYSREFLLYDFDLKQGDSTKVGPQTFGVRPIIDSSITIKVVAVDSVTIGNVLRKRLKISYPVCNKYPQTGSMYWVEGIGSLSNPMYAGDCLCDACEAYYTMFCFKLDTTQVYVNPNYSGCNFTHVATQEVDTRSLKIYPNPFSEKITLDNTEQIHQLRIFSVHGQLMKVVAATELPTISLVDLPNGCYWLTAFDKQNARIGTQKMIKMEGKH